MTAEAPYKGLAPYTVDDAGLFFGRDADRDLVIANLMAARFTVVYGSSGVGKSSLLRAGVQHRLRDIARENVRTTGTPQLAVFVYSTWRDDPLPGLLHGIHAAVADAWQSDSSKPSGERLDEHLDDALRRAAESVDGELVVILDQFEDYFQNHPGDEATTQFATEFARAVASEAVRASFLVSMREDALAKLDSFEGRIPNLFSNLLRIEPLDRDSARWAIEAPIDQYNRRNSPPASIDPALVDAVLDQVRIGRLTMGDPERLARASHADQRERIEAAYLQLVMKRLWDTEIAHAVGTPVELRLSTLEGLGGAEHIVHTHLDATMDDLSARERRIAARVFGYLVTPSATRIAHSAADLAAYADVGAPELEPVLTKLCAARILQPVAPHSDRLAATRYEIFHDLLAPAILDWRQRFLRDTERDLAGRQLAIERRRVWFLRRRVISLSVLLLAVVILGIAALFATDAQQVVLSREASRGLESLFLACFVFGALFTLLSALLGVHGIGHVAHLGAGHHTGAVSHGGGSFARRFRAPLANSSSMLAFLTWFGAAGYLLERYADWVLGAVLLGAVAAGTLGWVLINRFLDLILSGEREMDPEEYRLEGTIGRVTVAIPAGGTGEVVFTKGGVRRSEAAHAATGALPRGTEVVITNYAGGFATVEPWSALLDER